MKPPVVLPRRADAGREAIYAEAEATGRELLDTGKVAAFLVAGGQGTRLGYNGPKGEFPVTPVKEKPLFQVFAEQILAAGRRHGKVVPWYIMTSDANDAATRAFFEKHDFFGLDNSDVMFFTQGMMPAFSPTGEMLLAEKDSLALSPDGHGGSLRALAKSGALADMKKRGVEHLSYFQVDNPLVRVLDPLFLGLHANFGSEMSSKGLPKNDPLEKVGNFCVGDGKLMVIEYSDLPDELARQTNDDGSLKFDAGSIAIHAMSVDFIDRLTSGQEVTLPWHRAEKKVPHLSEPSPEAPNAVKLEQFVFDAIPLADNAIVQATERAEEFSPVKNAEGNDSPATSRRDQVRRAARWLAAAGVEVPATADGEPDALVEISPPFRRLRRSAGGKVAAAHVDPAGRADLPRGVGSDTMASDQPSNGTSPSTPTPFAQMLAGGHHNSLGRTDEVVEQVLAEPDRFEELFACYRSPDAVVRLRTSSAVKRVAAENRGLVIPYIDRLLDKVAALDQASAQWTLAQLFDRLAGDLTPRQRASAVRIMKRNLAEHDDWIVLNTTIDMLTAWAADDAALRRWLRPHLKRLSGDSRKSVASRAGKALERLSG